MTKLQIINKTTGLNIPAEKWEPLTSEMKPFPKVAFYTTEKDSYLKLGIDRKLMRKIIKFQNELFRNQK